MLSGAEQISKERSRQFEEEARKNEQKSEEPDKLKEPVPEPEQSKSGLIAQMRVIDYALSLLIAWSFLKDAKAWKEISATNDRAELEYLAECYGELCAYYSFRTHPLLTFGTALFGVYAGRSMLYLNSQSEKQKDKPKPENESENLRPVQ